MKNKIIKLKKQIQKSNNKKYKSKIKHKINPSRSLKQLRQVKQINSINQKTLK